MTTQAPSRAETECNILAERLVSELTELGFEAELSLPPGSNPNRIYLTIAGQTRLNLEPAPLHRLLEQALTKIPCPVESLPILVEGDSKIVHLWTDRVVVERFKPTVYSYTHNRYGNVEGTDHLRVRFSAALFREMAELPEDMPHRPRSAFLAQIDHGGIPLLVQRRVTPSNLEVRIKRFHIGSPLHRYRYTENYPTTLASGPLVRWSRFDRPVVCFDWRHPLRDDEGKRLADEPISEDYAALWMDNVPDAREMARQTFSWMERRFAQSNVLLVDMCLFVDYPGQQIFGEISPDCMRLRLGLGDPASTEATDKDVWRNGGSAENLAARYTQAFGTIFGESSGRL
ncbi:MAG: hypothetical protein K0U98_15765 [Deltaproteobacteria bacterium]|nr:hypothetical protein [Deltaproteobacteria bacterium]